MLRLSTNAGQRRWPLTATASFCLLLAIGGLAYVWRTGEMRLSVAVMMAVPLAVEAADAQQPCDRATLELAKRETARRNLGVRQHGIRHYLDLVADGRVDLTGMLTHTFPLESWRDAFAALATQADTGAIKVAFDFRRGA